MNEACPMAPLVEARHDGGLDERDRASIDRHLAACARCADLAKELVRVRDAMQVAPQSAIDIQRGRVRLLRAAAEARIAPRRRPIPIALRGLVAAAILAACAGLVVARPHPAPLRLAHLPAAPQLARARTETIVQPEPGARLERTTTDGTEIVILETGAALFSVRPLSGGERFLVRTADAEVEVRGTIFRVEARDGRIQSVQVTEGKVEVRFDGSTSLVITGGAWERPPRPIAAPRITRSATPPSVDRALPAPTAAAPSASPRAAPRPDALTEGVRMADRGDYDSAIERLQSFSDTHPNDDRAEDAAFLIILSLQRAGRTAEARAAVERYRARYPLGYRRAEVENIARHLRE